MERGVQMTVLITSAYGIWGRGNYVLTYHYSGITLQAQ